MSYEQLWAPWRLSYITDTKDQQPQKTSGPDGCFLCRYRDGEADAENFVVARGTASIVVLNRYPYNNGHLLIAPLAHKGGLDELDEAELLGCMKQLQRLTAALRKVLTADGFNIGLNLGKVAGAGLPGHLHWHLVPRWNGDTNFMPVLGGVNVIPQSLQALHELLLAELGPSQTPSEPA